MLTSIQRLRKFGVFKDYAKTQDATDFTVKNIIYGWNYSGKTTLSRLFQALAVKSLAGTDFKDATFSIVDDQGRVTSEATIATNNYVIEVFNSDFVAKNIGWDGSAFEPILLLGEDSVDAEKEIDAIEEKVQRCRQAYRKIKTKSDGAEEALRSAKTQEARTIRQAIGLVEAFNATHLTNEIERVSSDSASYLLDDAVYKAQARIALASEADRPKPVSLTPLAIQDIAALARNAETVLSEIPKFSETIDFLKTNPSISDWVERGLVLHEEKSACEFCGNPLDEDRIRAFHAHFSQDLRNHKTKVVTMQGRVSGLVLPEPSLPAEAFAPQFQGRAASLKSKIGLAVAAYNSDVAALAEALAHKAVNSFAAVNGPALCPASDIWLRLKVESLLDLISENNRFIGEFSNQKRDAVLRLKSHHAASFLLSQGLDKFANMQERTGRHLRTLERVARTYKAEIDNLQAKINRSQKGREKINERMTSLLGSDVISIRVVSIDGQDRFQLVRGDVPARNLSDGERMAIAFAFFLTKLEEHADLRKVLVYIDDPISSLDSNHVFQVFALIESTFFRKVQGHGGNEEWTTSCNQIFISTHNFEFLELLKKLPCSKNKTSYLYVRRLTPDSSTFGAMPRAILACTSEYHYLFGLIHGFYISPDKTSLEHLLMLPNAMRRFMELYTYMRLPQPGSTVEQRSEILFGREQAKRIVKLLHHFSHLESVDRLATHTNLIADIEAVVADLIELIRQDTRHHEALMASL